MTYHFHSYEMFENRQMYRGKKQVNGCQGLEGWEEWGVTANGHGVSFGGDENIKITLSSWLPNSECAIII